MGAPHLAARRRRHELRGRQPQAHAGVAQAPEGVARERPGHDRVRPRRAAGVGEKDGHVSGAREDRARGQAVEDGRVGR